MARSDNENIIRRVYHSVKESVITYQLPPGERLNIEVLADQLRVSTTPVRECLNRLVAEDLIVLVPRMGFFMKGLLESEIRDLYELNHVLLDWSLVHLISNQLDGVAEGFPEFEPVIRKLQQPEQFSSHQLAKSYSKLFACIARQAGNSEIDLRIRNINDRLHYIRVCECEMQRDPLNQVLPLFLLFTNGRYDELRSALNLFHEDRLKLLPKIIRAKSFNDRMLFEAYEA